MNERPTDLDATRAAIVSRGLVATASGYLTSDVAMQIPFEALGPFKDLLKKYFSAGPWSEADATALSGLIVGNIEPDWWEHDLGGGITLAHGIDGERYQLWVSGVASPTESIFDRVFDGPVIPETTPHPRKVKFTFGGTPSPGSWHRRTDPDPPIDPRTKRLLAEPDVTDVMVAGDFVTIGLAGTASWEERLEPLLALTTELFADAGSGVAAPERTRDELLREAGHAGATVQEADLHLLDPNDSDHRSRLDGAFDSPDPRVRRIGVAILAEADDRSVRHSAVKRGYADESRIVRRTAVDVAADTTDPALRSFLESALHDDDHWNRWRAVRALGDLGIEQSREKVVALTEDPEFRVRFEVERVLRGNPVAT